MQRETVIRILHKEKPRLTSEFGVKKIMLFGSVARDEAGKDSDIDLLVEFNKPMGYFGFFALQDHLENLFGCHVDLGTQASLRPELKARVLEDLIHVA
jgi:predicted nucleotidyltransferase